MMPSKKVLSVFIISLSIVIFIILIFKKEELIKVVDFGNSLVSGESLTIPQNPDWQNQISSLEIQNKNLNTTNSTSDNLTDTTTVSLMSNYLALKESGLLTEDSALRLIDETLNFIGTSGQSKTNSGFNLKIVSTTGISVFQYGENLGLILKNNNPINLRNGLAITSEAIESKDPQLVKDLSIVINESESLISKIREMDVPSIFEKNHRGMLEGLILISESLRDLQKVFTDPVVALNSLDRYVSGVNMFTSSGMGIFTFIKDSGIIYEQGSGGYFLLYGI